MECKQCHKTVEQVEGKRQREYCNDACRMAFKRAQAKANTEQTISEQITITEQIETISEQRSDWQKQLDDLPSGVARPACKQEPLEVDPDDMHQDEDWDGRWQSSVEYLDKIWNLLNLTVAELTQMHQWIPVWKHARGAA